MKTNCIDCQFCDNGEPIKAWPTDSPERPYDLIIVNDPADGLAASTDTVRRDVGCGLCGSPPNRTGELCSNKRCSRAWKTEESWRSYLRHCEARDTYLAANYRVERLPTREGGSK